MNGWSQKMKFASDTGKMKVQMVNRMDEQTGEMQANRINLYTKSMVEISLRSSFHLTTEPTKSRSTNESLDPTHDLYAGGARDERARE